MPGIHGLNRLLKSIAFILVFAVLLFQVQQLVTPKWDWPDESERRSHQVKGIYNEPEHSMDVLWIGSSHMHAGVSPMEIYQQTGIRSYNLATAGQPLPLSEQWLRIVLKSQTPKLVVLDVASIFLSQKADFYSSFWYFIIDTMPTSRIADRLSIVTSYTKQKNGEVTPGDLFSGLFPIIRYHGNLLLKEDDYLDIHDDLVYSRKGTVFYTSIRPAYDLEGYLNEELLQEYVNEPKQLSSNSKALRKRFKYNTAYLDNIVQLCKDNGCELVLTKIPVNVKDNTDVGHWNAEKNTLISNYAKQRGVTFLDLNLEDVGIDWEKDTPDYGKHLNYNGCGKVSAFFSKWLTENYSFAKSDDPALTNSWQKQLEVYNNEAKYLDLAMETNLEAYMSCLKNGNYTVLAAVTGTLGDYWNENYNRQFAELMGTETDLCLSSEAGSFNYFAASSNGMLISEKTESSEGTLRDRLPDGKKLKIKNSVNKKVPETTISIGDVKYFSSKSGLIFVVYDNDLHCVVDCAEVKSLEDGAYAINHSTSSYLRELRLCLLDYEYENLKGL